jgi:hypothetical protein
MHMKIQERLCLLSEAWTYLYMDRTAGLQNCYIWPAHIRPNPMLISTGFFKYPLELKKKIQLELKKKNQLK